MNTNECVFSAVPQKVSVMDFRVLLADSDTEILDLYRSYFGRHWYGVETVGSGVECVAALRAIRPDVLVLHRNLLWGGFDGVMERIRNDRDLPLVPVVAIEEHHCDRPRDAQIFATLTTPFRLGELDRVLRRVFTSAIARG